MTLNTFQDVLDRLETTSFGADLVGGKIHWTNQNGEVVAHATIKAILSWAATNNSIMWAYAVEQFKEAKVPVIIPSNTKSNYIADVKDQEAAELAAKVAEEAGAEYLYRANNGANGLYLAIFDFKAQSIELPADAVQKRLRSAVAYVVQMLGNIKDILANKKRLEEGRSLLEQFEKSHQQQINFIFQNSPLNEEASRLLTSIVNWQKQLDKNPKDVVIWMAAAREKWAKLINR